MPPDGEAAAHPPAGLCRIGTIVNTHGVAGELRVLPYNPDSSSMQPGQEITLCWPERSQRVRVRSVRPHKRFRLIQLEGCDSATRAETLVGAEVAVDADTLPPAGPNEVYHHDLIGARVCTDDGRELGVIEELLVTGSNDVCVVRGDSGEHLIPLIEDVVRTIDLVNRRLVITPLPGLLDA
ncbi:MAG TPA: ribosome maturation factor RimM [Candidatus Binatia bacterium]|nr:ribosome maturation factor RimM [Candidatus Binatia bacterium]